MKEKEYKRGDIVWINLDKGIGSEQYGKRPAVIIQCDVGNKFSPTLIVIMLTTMDNKHKRDLPTHGILYKNNDYYFPTSEAKANIALCEQIRTIDKRRVLSIAGHVHQESMYKIDNALKSALSLF